MKNKYNVVGLISVGKLGQYKTYREEFVVRASDREKAFKLARKRMTDRARKYKSSADAYYYEIVKLRKCMR